MTFFVIALFIVLIWYSTVTNHIPKRGREGIASGKEVMAVITNNNKGADRPVTLRAEGGGRRFKVKMKGTEAHLWVKGDSIRVLISEENPKKYRVCFNDYFRENEEHIRSYAAELLEKKVKTFTPAAKCVQYTSETAEAIKKSKLNSQRIFAFITMMRMIDSYMVIAVLLGVFCICTYMLRDLKFKALLVPAIAIALIVWYISAAVKMCVKIKTEAEKN